ncbi:glucose-1-phosphate thymidylyltransferase [Acidobacteriota bacterium]
MKGLILSGGAGTRLRPITYNRAKQLVPVANKPILFYGIEAIAAAGITEIGIIVGDTREEVSSAVGNGSRWGVQVTYIYQEEPLGLAHCVLIAREYLGEAPFVMYLGDNLIKSGINHFVEEFKTGGGNAQILLAHVSNPSQFGVAELEDGRVISLIEKPKEPKSDLALVGVYMFDPTIHEAVRAIKPSWRNELEITDAIQYLIDHGYDVRPHIVNGWWKDTGKLEDILEANRIILDSIDTNIETEPDGDTRLEGKVAIGKGTTITGSVIRGPAIIGCNCEIKNSFVGPFTALQDGVRIINSEIENSIVCEQSLISDAQQRIDGSLIGRDVVISKSQARPKSYRFVVGDSSRLSL